jgi:L-alanine-DL-glutamate epimerase-like enolase superfamily enzyme
MLTIARVDLHLIGVRRHTGFPSQHVIVELTTSHGTGWGEMSDLGHLPLYQFDLDLLGRTLNDLLVGKDAEDRLGIEAMMVRAFPDEGHMYSRSGLVRQGVDLAVIDAIGRYHGLPATTVLGGRRRDSVPVCYPLFRLAAGDLPDRHLETVATKSAEGFDLFRLYTGGDMAAERAFLEAFRSRHPALRIKSFDFSNVLPWRDALRWTAELAEIVDPELVESATPRDDLDGMRAFAKRSRWPHSEHVVSTSHAWRLVRFGAVDVLNVSPYVLGGITPALRVADFAAVARIGVLIGTTQEMGIGTAAAAVLGGVAPSIDHPCDNVGPRLYTADVVDPPICYENGHLMVPDGPGLGVTVDRERLRALGEGVRIGVGLSPRELVDRVVRPAGG